MSVDRVPHRRTRTGSKDDLSLMLPPASASQGWVAPPPSGLHGPHPPVTPRPGLMLSAQSVMMRPHHRSPRSSRSPPSQKRARRTLEDGTLLRGPPARDSSRDPARLKRQRIVHELVDTEKRFVTVLDVLESEIRQPVRQRHLLTDEQVEQLFANVADIRRLHKSFLLRLWLLTTPAAPAPFRNQDVDKRLFQACDDLPHLFLEYARHASLFALYCKAHATAQSTQLLAHLLRSQPSFADFIKKQLEIPQANRQTLQSLLAAIPQRVCKYPLLLKEYLKTLEENDPLQAPMQEALQAVSGLLDEIDQHTGPVMSDFVQLKRIAARLKPSRKQKGFHLLEDGRAFIHEGDFEVLKPHAYGSYAFLFTDLLLLCKPRGELFKITRVLPLSALILCATHDVDEPGGRPRLQMAEVGRGIFRVQFASGPGHQQWAAVLHKQLNPPSTPAARLASPSSPLQALRDGSQTSRPLGPSLGVVPTLSLPTQAPNSAPLPSELSGCEACSHRQGQLDKERARRKEAEARLKEMEGALKALKRRVAQQNKIILDLSQLSHATPPTRVSPLARSRTLPNTPDAPSRASERSDEEPEEAPHSSPVPARHVLEAVRDRLQESAAQDGPAPTLRTRSEDIHGGDSHSESSTHSVSDSEEVSVREGFSSRAYKQSQANRKTVLIHRASQPTLVRTAQFTLLAPSSATPSTSEAEEENPSTSPSLSRVLKRRGRASSHKKHHRVSRSHTEGHSKYLNSL